MKSFLTHLECTYCRAAYSADEPHRTCPLPDCGKVLYPRYDLQGAADALRREDLARRPANMWRYFEVGDRRESTFLRLLDRLQDAARYMRDAYGMYDCLRRMDLTYLHVLRMPA